MARLPVPMSNEALSAAHTFILERERAQLLDEGYKFDVVEAVIAEQGDNPAHAKIAVRQLNDVVQHEDWPTTLAAYARCARIVRGQGSGVEGQTEDREPATVALKQAVDGLSQPPDIQSLISNLQSLTGPINVFFDKVMVMAEEAGLRAARLSLLQRIVSQADGIADLSKLEGF